MTEKEKMLAGELYDWGDPELMEIWTSGKNLMQRFNSLSYSQREEQMEILDELLGERGENTQITAPFYIDYGKFIGNNVTIGAGSVVTKSIPDNVLAYGSPCRVVREI